ncbi:MAG TPA: DUF6338 family protein [Thermoleophilaceae bacterium]|nr:DUF6338 family protein [Thermoleophilaceae bacterium]
MIGTIEALGVFLLMILPGFVCLRAFEYGRPPLRIRGALGEIGGAVMISTVVWSGLYLWRGKDLLPVVVGDSGESARQRLDAFAELAGLSILIGIAIALLARLGDQLSRRAALFLLKRHSRKSAQARRNNANATNDDGTPVTTVEKSGWLTRVRSGVGRWMRRRLRARTLPASAWDRLMTRLANRGKPVVCKVRTSDGAEILGAFASAGYADWEADGRGLLLDVEVVADPDGRIRPLPMSQGIFIPGNEIVTLSVVALPDEALSLKTDE